MGQTEIMSKEDEFCEVCKKEVKNEEKGMQCDVCLSWFHGGCVDVSKPLYEAILKYGSAKSGCSIQWYCRTCTVGVGKLLGKVKNVSERQEKSEQVTVDLIKEMKELRKEMEGIAAINVELEQIREGLAEVRKNNVDCSKLEEKVGIRVSSLAEIMKEQQQGVDSNRVPPIKVDDRKLKAEVMEAMERDKRKDNLVFIGIPEGTKDIARGKVEDICRLLGGELSEIVSVERLGKPDAIKGLVRVKFDSSEGRMNMLTKAKKLRNVKEYESIFVAPDLTKTQQEVDKALREKLKEVRKDEPDAKINRGQIIKYDNGVRQVLWENSN